MASKEVLINEHSLYILEDCAKRIAKRHPEDNELCWCELSTPINEFGLHTGWCHQLRKYFKIGEYKE